MSDETTKSILKKITIEHSTPRPVPGSKLTSKVFHDCAKLTPGDLARLAAQATGHLDDSSFDMTVGIAYTGIFFAAAVAGGRNVAILGTDNVIYGPNLKGERVILVDDVVYSGERILKAAKLIEEAGGKLVGFACIVDRREQNGELSGKPLYSAFQG